MTSLKPITQPVETLLETMRMGGIDKAIVFSAGPIIGPKFNTMIGESTAEHKERLIPFIRVNPYDGEKALEEIDRCVKQFGMKGIKLHPGFQVFKLDSPLVHPIMEKASRLKLKVLTHTGEPPSLASPLKADPLADHFPDVPLILGHMGEIYLGSDAVRVAKKHDNIYLETSWAPKSAVEYALSELGSTRLILGSDTPYGHPAIERRKFELITMSEEDRENILGKNIASLLGLIR